MSESLLHGEDAGAGLRRRHGKADPQTVFGVGAGPARRRAGREALSPEMPALTMCETLWASSRRRETHPER